MNADIKRTLVDTFGRISYLFVIFFFFIYILYLHNEVPEALKEAWTASLSFLSVLATLGAAYIASQLFNDWRDQFRLELKSKYCKDILDNIFQMNQLTQSSYLFSQFLKPKTDFIQSIADKMSSDSLNMNVPLKNIQNLMSMIGEGIFTQDEVADFNKYFGGIYQYQNLITIITIKESHETNDDFPKKLKKAYEDCESQSTKVKSIVTKYHLLDIEHNKALN